MSVWRARGVLSVQRRPRRRELLPSCRHHLQVLRHPAETHTSASDKLQGRWDLSTRAASPRAVSEILSWCDALTRTASILDPNKAQAGPVCPEQVLPHEEPVQPTRACLLVRSVGVQRRSGLIQQGWPRAPVLKKSVPSRERAVAGGDSLHEQRGRRTGSGRLWVGRKRPASPTRWGGAGNRGDRRNTAQLGRDAARGPARAVRRNVRLKARKQSRSRRAHGPVRLWVLL